MNAVTRSSGRKISGNDTRVSWRVLTVKVGGRVDPSVVGILDKLTGRDVARVVASTPPSFVVDPSTYPIASPWSSSDLQRIVFEDIFGEEIPQNTRSVSMRIPAVARARGLLVSTIARLPMVQLGVDEQIPPLTDAAARAAFRDAQPTWLYRSDDGTSPQHKLAWTVDDLIFYGWSCWWRTNGADGFPLSTQRINMGDWQVTADGKVEVVGHENVKSSDVILIPGFHEGILSYGAEPLRDARQLYAVVRQRLASPIPPINLHQVEGEPLTETEIDALIDRWVTARNNPTNGGVGYSNKAIEVIELTGGDDSALMIEARNAAAVDMARMIGVSAGMIDATAPKASLNYETQSGRNQEFVDLDLQQYIAPIEARLSMDDVSPRSKHVAFDLTNYTAPVPSPTGPALQD